MIALVPLDTKPRLPLCWSCARRFYGRKHTVVVVDGAPREVHLHCARELQRDGEVAS